MAQKGTALIDGAATDEVFASSDSILHRGQFGNQKGLQQFFSPPELSELAKKVIGNRVAVCDLTAGDGSLLRAFDTPYSFGVEIDKDQIANSEGSYHAVKGDIQHVYPLLRQVAPEFDGFVLNPPFGLDWEDDTIVEGRKVNSAVATLIYATRLLSFNGQYVFVCGLPQFHKDIAPLPEAAGIYAVIEVDDLFEGTKWPCAVAFGVNAELRKDAYPTATSGFATRELSRSMLDLVYGWVSDERAKAIGPHQAVTHSTWNTQIILDAWSAIQTEYDRRLEGRIKRREFDVELAGGGLLNVLPSPFATIALDKLGERARVNRLHHQSINYFAQNERDWLVLHGLEQSGILRIDPRVHVKVDEVLAQVRRTIVPLYPIKPQQRLGFLTDREALKALKSDPERGFVKGEHYKLSTRTQTLIEPREEQREKKGKPGEWKTVVLETARKVLNVTVGHWSFTDSDRDSEHIRYLIDHFEMPDPGTVNDRFPDELEAIRKVIDKVDQRFWENSLAYHRKDPAKNPMPLRLREFQKEDIARLVFKGGGLLSWQQGLGKTLGGILFSEVCRELGAQHATLYITAPDLLAQWQRELERLTGEKAVLIRDQAHARDIRRRLRDRNEGGTYITWYEHLSVGKTRGKNGSLLLPEVVVREKEVFKTLWHGGYTFVKLASEDSKVQCELPIGDGNGNIETLNVTPCDYNDPDKLPSGSVYFPPIHKTLKKAITSKELCPACEADRKSGWNGTHCEAEKPDGSVCGYSHYLSRVKPIGSFLSTAFSHGVIVADEITAIQGNTSLKSRAIRGLRAKHKLGMTGTPIKNFVGQAFWLLWWCLGNGTLRFPYTYKGGHSKFEQDFAVMEWIKVGNRKEAAQAKPEVTNLSMLWRLLASSIIRRRKEETGEPIVPIYFHEVHAPVAMSQLQQYGKWMKDFHKFFKEMNPEHPVVQAGMEEVMAPMLGMQWKLDYAMTLPEADPDREWTGIPVSNFTPANLRVLELAMALVKDGRKVLIGSHLVPVSKWLADRLNEKGVNAVHILDDHTEKTLGHKKRGERVYSFQTDDAQVLCAGVKAIRLGHNLDAANAVILHGLDWDYETLDQFIQRAHRLTSKEPVDVYVVIPKIDSAEGENGTETITERKWGILNQKGQAADLALDGRLIEKEEETIDLSAIYRELQERGVRLDGSEPLEEDVEAAWEKLPELDDYVVPEGLIPQRENEADIDPFERNPAIALALEALFLWMRTPTSGNAKPIKKFETEQKLDEAIDEAVNEAVGDAPEQAVTFQKARLVPTRDEGYVAVPIPDDVPSGNTDEPTETVGTRVLEPVDEPTTELPATDDPWDEPTTDDDPKTDSDGPLCDGLEDDAANEPEDELEALKRQLAEAQAEIERLKSQPTQLSLFAA